MLGAEVVWAEPEVIVRVTTICPGVSPLRITVFVSSESPILTMTCCGGVAEEIVVARVCAAEPPNVREELLKLRVVLPKLAPVVLAKVPP